MRISKSIGSIRPVARCIGAALALSAAVTMLCSPTAFADPEENSAEGADIEKSEMVYGLLESDGTLRETYVVNRFDSDEPCSVEDYGDYSLVSNLSTTQVLAVNYGKVAFDKGAEPFFYQGALEGAQLPWNVAIEYELDGKKIEPADLAGRSGLLTIKADTSKNPQANRAFYDSYLLQVTFTLDGDLCTDIKAGDATIAASGKDQTVAFTVLPGHDGSFELSAAVKDFEMPSAQIVALPYSSVVEIPDTSEMENGLTDLSNAISQLNQGTSELASGMAQLSSGAANLESGAGQIGEGLAQLATLSSQIVDGSKAIDDSLALIAGSVANMDLSSFDSLAENAPKLREAAEGLGMLKESMQELVDGYTQMAATFGSLATIVNANAPSDEEIAAISAAAMSDEKAATALQKLLTSYYATQEIVNGFSAAGGSSTEGLEQLQTVIGDGGSIDQAIGMLNTIADSLEEISLDQFKELATGLSDLSSGYSQFHEGLVSYTQGVQALSDNYGALSSGISQLASGASASSTGADELSNGVNQLNSAANDLPAQMRERIDDMTADYEFPEFEPVSFVDKRNKNVVAVQFALLTDAIEKPEPEPAAPEPEPEPSILDRFLALFE